MLVQRGARIGAPSFTSQAFPLCAHRRTQSGRNLGCRGREARPRRRIQSFSRNLSLNIVSMASSIRSLFFTGLYETVSVATPRQTSFLVLASKRSRIIVPLL